jgi:hypothetical protein
MTAPAREGKAGAASCNPRIPRLGPQRSRCSSRPSKRDPILITNGRDAGPAGIAAGTGDFRIARFRQPRSALLTIVLNGSGPLLAVGECQQLRARKRYTYARQSESLGAAAGQTVEARPVRQPDAGRRALAQRLFEQHSSASTSRQPRLWSRHGPTPTAPGPTPWAACRRRRIARVHCEAHRPPKARSRPPSPDVVPS